MSLINEALKKAQKQRTGEAPTLSSLPSIGGERPAQIAKRKAPPGFNALLMRLGLGLGALLIVVAGGLFLLRDKGPATPPPAAPVATATPSPAPASSAAAPVAAPAAPIAAPAPVSTLVVPNATPSTPAAPAPIHSEPIAVQAKPEPIAPRAEPVRPAVAQAPAPVVEQPEPVKPAAPPRKLEARAVNFIDGIRVAGIRASATDSKVLMNDRVYRIGDVIEHEMGLKLVGITSSSLTFEDEQGGRYTRNF